MRRCTAGSGVDSNLDAHNDGLGMKPGEGAQLGIGGCPQAFAVAGLTMKKGVLAHEVQGVLVSQLGLAEGAELLRSQHQFQFGGQSRLHAHQFFGSFWKNGD